MAEGCQRESKVQRRGRLGIMEVECRHNVGVKRAQEGHTASAVADNDEFASEFRHDVSN